MTRVKIIRTKRELVWLRRQLHEAKAITFDLETSGEGTGKKHRYHKPWDPDGRIVMAGFTWTEGLGVSVPLHHSHSPWRNPDGVLRYLKPELEVPTKKYIAHNGKFDCTWLASKGVFVRQTFDTMLAAHLLDENRKKGLKFLASELFGINEYDEDLKDAYNMPLKRLAVYQAKDVDYTHRLYEVFKAELQQQPRVKRIFTQLMMPGSNALVKVETVGMYVDGKNLKKQTRLKTAERDKVEAKLRQYVPVDKRETLNFRSPQQVGRWLFGDLKLPLIMKTKTGAPSTNEDVMLQLAKRHPAAKLLLRYRTLETKDLRTYLHAWEKTRDPRSRVHTNYKLFGTVTGRLSSERPNMQQVPRESSMRTCFGAPDGWTFLESDYSQIELRIAAMCAREPTLLRIFATGGDPHLTTAAEVSGLTEAEVTASDATGKTEFRKKAKGVNFGFLYGMGEWKFIDYARTSYGVEVTEEEAHIYRKRFFRLYSELPRWHERQKRLALSLGQVHSPLGRVRHLPDVWSDDKKVSEEAKRQAINSPIQSAASDFMLCALIRLSDMLDFARARIVGTVHDSILFEVRNEYLEEATPIIRQVMEDIAYIERVFKTEITVPIEVEIKTGQHWGAGKVVV